MSDPINPDHYKSGAIQTIDYIEAKGLGRGFNAGNVIKYVSRYRKKNGLEDLNKALWYLKRLIALEEAGLEDTDENAAALPAKTFVVTMTDGSRVGTRLSGTILDLLSIMIDEGKDVTSISNITIKEADNA